ncbi:hypothetical protein [Aequorivita capsosiphonis]|uniref:hypothetical protein n=1 Tax=Aequorivita capsosiphonis TaxID=487317 RepID=UPI0004123257|nr:hypothetical protein [Aequorivita capsosiphonis]
MKLIFTSLLILYSLYSFSQNKETKTTSSANDTILDIQKAATVLSKENLQESIKPQLSDTLKPSLFEQVNKLDEVIVKSKSKFDAVSLGIIQKEIKPLTQYERQLYTAGNFKPIHLLSLLGGSLQVDPIINAISGRTKRLKKYIQFEKKERNLIFLEDHFTEYMLNNLNIEEEQIGRFLNYLIENEKLQVLIDRKDNGELYFFIGDEWFKFKSIQKEKPSLSKDPVFKEK